MKSAGRVMRVALRNLGAGTAVAVIVYSFMAYLDPAVFIPALSAFTFCQ
jgi:hypothetical protein